MKKIKTLGLLAAIYMAFAPQSFANVTVRAAGGGNCLNVSPGAYTSLTDIIITEVAAGDFAVQAGTTLILTAPAGFEFQAGAGTVSYTAGMDITASSISVTASTITVTMTVGSNTKMDVLRIRNIRARALSANAVGRILRTATGGTATIAGDAPGAGVNHGSLTGTGLGATFTSVASGNWSNPAIWSGGVVPSCTDNVSISHSVTADMTASVNDVTVTTGGTLVTDNAITVGGTFALTGTGAYTHNNMTNASTTIFAGTEAFDNTSTIVIQKWYDRNIPFATSISGDLGNVTFNYTGTWSQDGLFAPAKVKGTLTIASGTITLDDGTGMTTALTLQDVVVTSAGNLFVQSGTARDLTLVTGNFTDNSASAGLTSIVYRSIGNFTWTVNGNLTVSHRFSIMEGNATTDVGSASIDISGNLTISGGQFDGLKSVTGPLTVDVAGNTVISGSPTYVYFKKNYAGDFTFSTTNLTVSGGAANYFLGSTTPTGAATFNISNDLTVTGASTKLWMNYATTNTATTDLNIGNDLIVTNAEFTVANHLGSVSMDVTRNIQMSGATSYIYGQRATNATGTANLTVNGNVTLSGGTFMQSRGLGNASTTITEYIDITGATFYGINNTASGNNGLSTLSCSDITLNGGKFYLHRSQVTDSRTVVVDVTNDVNVNFTASTDEFAFISRASSNNAQLDLSIGGNLYLSGNTDAYFTTSVCTGTETVDIAGDVVVSGGKLRFNGNEFTASNGHNLTGVINGSLIVSGGSVCLSINRGTVIWTIAGDYNQTGGYVFHRYNSGDMTVTVNGDYTQSNGVAALYARPSVLSTNNQALVINGDAMFDNATMIFDSSSASTATHTLYFRGANVTFGDNTVFTHIGHLTTSAVFGSIRYDRAGTISWNRLTSDFDMQHVKQSVTAGTTLDVSGSANDMLIASHSSATSATHTSLTVDGTLDMGTLMITGRSEPGYYSRAYFSNGSRLITAHTGGLYSGSASNSCIYPMIAAGIGMDYYLGSTSTVEYNGTDTQVITGTGLGLASSTDHRYGYLDINFQGTPDIEFAYPYDDNIYVRTGLVLTSGELNLDNDHVTATGGRVLNILNGASITRSSGYIRSETEDGSGAVNWNITTTGSFVFPFGYNSASYIPFTFQSTSGSADDVLIGTYHSASDNTPYPPSVSHVHDIGGADNSGNTVDRFWRIEATGSVTANLLFSYVSSEGSGVANPRAQLWEPVSGGWFPPAGGQSNPTGTTTQTNGNTTFNSWWTLSSSASPLPIQLLSFTATPVNRTVKLAWSTATEINNSHFNVQRSDRGDVFTDVLHVAGAGNSNTVLNYYAVDNQPLPGVSYYRLKQTDYDGRFTYSNVRVVYMNNNVPVSLFPNPFRGTSVQVAVGETEQDNMEVNLYDLAGKKIESDIKIGNVAAGGVVTLDFGTELAPGAYMIEIKTTDGNFRQRIVKQ